MRLGIRGKLFAGSFGLIILSLLAGEMYLRPAIEANLLERIRADLFARLALIERDATKLTDLQRGGWDALADELGPRAHGRITFIDGAGEACLAAMNRRGAEFIAADALTKGIVAEITQAPLRDHERPKSEGFK